MYNTDYEEGLLRERVINAIHKLNLTERAFAMEIGRQPTNVYQVLAGERHFPRGFCADIIKKYPQINKDWLYFGEGSIFGEDKPKTPENTRPRLPKSLSGVRLTDYYEGEKRSECQEKPVITQFADYDFTLILKNNRMSPKYDRGDELAFKKSTIIEWGNDYLLDTDEGPKFGKIIDEGGKVKCLSYNKEEYQEFYVPKNHLFGYYRVVGVLRIL